MGHMLTLLTPNLLTAVCLFFEYSHSSAHFFNYTWPCVLSEYIIQNEMHLENIKITNAHHYSHNFNLTWYLFGVLTLIHFACFINSFSNGHQPLPAWESHIDCSKGIALPPSHEPWNHPSCLRGRNSCCPRPIVYDEKKVWAFTR